jgi:hypothetical protein
MNDAMVVGTEISTGWMTKTAEIFSRTGRKNRISSWKYEQRW